MFITIQLSSTLTTLAICAAVANGSPIAAPEPEITPFPNLVPTSPVDLATDISGERVISPLRVPAHEVTLRRREANAPVTIDNVVFPTGFPNLVPTKPVHIELGDALSASPLRVAETPVTLEKRGEPVTIDGIVYPTGFPNLVPTSVVDLATDSTFTTKPTTTWSTSTVTASSGAALRTEAVLVECVADVSGTAYTTACPTTTATKTYTPVTIDGVVYPTGFPDLVPSITVHLSTAAATPVEDDTTVDKKAVNAGRSLSPPMAGLVKGLLKALR